MTEVPPEVEALVQRYRRERTGLEADFYGEADTRKEFVEPLFMALGWDVLNQAHYAEPYKDVVNEYSLKIGTSYKAPDYAFRVGGGRKFFVEAKRPGVDIKSNRSPAYQLRRYGWTAKLPASVLTNFRHFAVYDCTRKPGEFDNSAAARTLLVSWDELSSRWSEIADLLGKESVYQGSLDRYAAGASRRRGTSMVDDAFLGQMEEWRAKLARDIAIRNKTLTVEELNEAVQQTIDRLVFLRIAEDRGVEQYEALKEAVKGSGVYPRLMTIFRAADVRYNSGLFHFRNDRQVSGAPDRLTPSLTVGDGVLRWMIGAMYYPASPYEFSVLPGDILGQVYEQFLGRVITLGPRHSATVEEKPEVRKAGGVYYTPTYIVDLIVARTLGRLLEGKTARQALNMKILDPACGSGSFLLGAYKYLLAWFTEKYAAGTAAQRKQAMYRDRDGEWRLTLAERKRILKSCVFGVDIDRQAVEVTKLSLMLKVLEGESDETINNQMQLLHVERVLPDLDQNIKSGNSLVGSDVNNFVNLTDVEESALNPFDWEVEFPSIIASGGFHAVIGNPPYDVLEKERGQASWPHGRLREYLRFKPSLADALGRKLNLYRLFLVQATGLVRPGGTFGMIVPLSLAADISTAQTRRFMLKSFTSLELDCFPQKDVPSRRIFRRAKLSTMVITGERAKGSVAMSTPIQVRVFPGNNLSEDHISNTITANDCALVDPEVSPIPLTGRSEWTLCQSIHANSSVARLGDLNSLVVSRGEINQTTYRAYITSDSSGVADLLKGVELAPFEQLTELSQGEREWIDGQALMLAQPRRKAPPAVRIATQRITGVDERRRLVAAVVSTGAWFADSTNSIATTTDDRTRLEYLVAVLNSDLMQWRFRLTSTNNNVGTNELEALPIVVPSAKNFDGVNAVIRAGRRVSNATRDLRAARSPAEQDRLGRRLRSAWKVLNDAVFDLYELNATERTLVTERLKKPTAVTLEY